MRYLAIDYGDKKIGLAFCDQLEIAMRPLPPVNNKNLATSIGEISRMINVNKIEALVVGIPLGEDNKETQQSIKTRFFINRLKDVMSLPIELWNETWTTKSAMSDMVSAGVSRKTRSEMVDSYAAMAILKEFLENKEIKK